MAGSTQTMGSRKDVEEGTSLDELSREKSYLGAVEPSEPAVAVSSWADNPAPDGGMTAWLVVLGASCTNFCSFGWINSVGVFQNYYHSTLFPQYSASQISWIPSLQIFFMTAMGVVIGPVYDRYGPRVLILIGSFMHVFGLMMASIASTYWEVLLAQGVCSAIGVAAIFQPSLNCIPSWFDKKRGAAFGLVAVGSSIGGVIFPIMISRLIDEINYGWSMRISAFLILGLLVVANLTVKSRFPPSPHKLTNGQLTKPFSEPAFVVMAVGMMCLTFGIFVPITWITVYGEAKGMSASLGQYLLPMLNAGSLFGRIFAGITADKLGKFNVFIFVGIASATLIFALWIPAAGNTATIVFAITFGFISGGYASLIAALPAQLASHKDIGYRIGLAFLVASIGGLTTGPIAGAILARQHGAWTGLQCFAGSFCLAGAVCVLAARFMSTGFKFATIF